MYVIFSLRICYDINTCKPLKIICIVNLQVGNVPNLAMKPVVDGLCSIEYKGESRDVSSQNVSLLSFLPGEPFRFIQIEYSRDRC